MKKILIILLFLIALISEAYADKVCNHPGNCSTKLGSGDRCSGSNAFKYIPYTSQDPNDPYAARQVFVCRDKAYPGHIERNNNRGFGLVAVGWGEYCAIYAGGNSVSDKSCVAAESMIGEIVDDITTLGVGILMRKNFCSFSPGDPLLEGGLIAVNSCDQPSDQVSCLRCLLLGRAAVTNGAAPADADYYAKTRCSVNPFEDPFGLGDLSNRNTNGSGINLSPEIKTVQPNQDGTGYIDNICKNAIPNLGKPLYDVNGNPVTVPYPDDSTHAGVSVNVPVYCPVTRCNIPTPDIKVKYFDEMGWRIGIITALAAVIDVVAPDIAPLVSTAAAFLDIWSAAEGNCCDITSLSDSNGRKSVGFLKIIQLKGELKGDQICANMFFPFGGWRTLACKPTLSKPVKFPNPPCGGLLKTTACGGGPSHSKGVLPVTSRVMECTNDLFGYFFAVPPDKVDTSDCQINNFVTFQKNMRNIVRLLLILYVILFGIKVVFGEKIDKRQIFSFILKFALVIFFSVGNFYEDTPSNDEHQNGLIFARNLLQSATNSFSVMVIEALQGGSSDFNDNNLCSFKHANYDANYKYLEIWDTLDCKLFSYLGFIPPSSDMSNSMESSGFLSRIRHGLFEHLWALLFTLCGVPILIFLLVFTVFLLSIVVHLAHIYILSMLATTILIFFGPIFVPLALFDATRDMYEKWLKLIVGYALQPVIVLGIIVFMVITFDKIIFTDCTFQKHQFDENKAYSYWVLDEAHANTKEGKYCKKSLGYLLAHMSPGKFSQNTDFIASSDVPAGQDTQSSKTGSYIALAKDALSELSSLLEALALTTFFLILFYVFASQMLGLARELVGGAGFGDMVVGATAVIDAALDAVVMAATDGQVSFGDVKEAAQRANTDVSKVEVMEAAVIGKAEGKNSAQAAAKNVEKQTENNKSDANTGSGKGDSSSKAGGAGGSSPKAPPGGAAGGAPKTAPRP